MNEYMSTWVYKETKDENIKMNVWKYENDIRDHDGTFFIFININTVSLQLPKFGIVMSL